MVNINYKLLSILCINVIYSISFSKCLVRTPTMETECLVRNQSCRLNVWWGHQPWRRSHKFLNVHYIVISGKPILPKKLEYR